MRKNERPPEKVYLLRFFCGCPWAGDTCSVGSSAGRKAVYR